MPESDAVTIATRATAAAFPCAAGGNWLGGRPCEHALSALRALHRVTENPLRRQLVDRLSLDRRELRFARDGRGRLGECLPERLVELVIEVVLPEEQRVLRLLSCARRKERHDRLHAVDVPERVQRELERLAAQDGRALDARLALVDRALLASAAEDVHQRRRALERVDVAR